MVRPYEDSVKAGGEAFFMSERKSASRLENAGGKKQQMGPTA